MARAAISGRLTWQAGEIVAVVPETARAKTLTVAFPAWPGHLPGQHLDVRLTAEDGYQAVRSYSISSPPEEPMVSFTVERLEDGEVSPYLTEEVRPGDCLEFRGPIGGYFVWEAGMGGPLFLVAGGSGIVPLMAMIRHRVATGSDVPVRLLYSVRSPAEIIYRSELDRLAAVQVGIQVIYTFTRAAPDGWTGYRRRIDALLLQEVFPSPDGLAYVCGSTGFVENAASTLVSLGTDPARVLTERFGPSGA